MFSHDHIDIKLFIHEYILMSIVTTITLILRRNKYTTFNKYMIKIYLNIKIIPDTAKVLANYIMTGKNDQIHNRLSTPK